MPAADALVGGDQTWETGISSRSAGTTNHVSKCDYKDVYPEFRFQLEGVSTRFDDINSRRQSSVNDNRNQLIQSCYMRDESFVDFPGSLFRKTLEGADQIWGQNSNVFGLYLIKQELTSDGYRLR